MLDRVEELLSWLRWPTVAAGVVLLAVLGWRAVGRESSIEKGDTRFYKRGADLFVEGEHLYYEQLPYVPGVHNPNTGYTYPPPFAPLSVWMVPLPYLVVRGVWLFAMVVCAVAACWVTWRLISVRGPPSRPRVVAALIGLVVVRFAINDLAHGQVNWLIVLLLALTLWQAERKNDRAAGLCLALALCIKPTSWLLLVWFALADRRPRLLGWCVLGAVVLLALPGLRYGPSDYVALCADWFTLMGDFADYNALHPDNNSLSVALGRLACGSRYQPPAVTPLLLSLDPAVVVPICRVAASVLVAAGFGFLCLRRVRDPAAPVAVLLLGALLSPITWKAHLVILLLPAAYLSRDLGSHPSRGRGIALGIVVLLLLLPSRALGGLGIEAFGTTTWCLVALWVLLVLPRAEGGVPARGPVTREVAVEGP